MDAYPQTTLNIHPVDTTFTGDIFLIFKNQTCMVHVYTSGVNFPYNYAPVGLQATVVAIGIKGGALYSAFLPVTIVNDMTVNFGTALNTTANFKQQLEA